MDVLCCLISFSSPGECSDILFFTSVTVTPHECDGVPNQRQLDCMFNELCRLISKRYQNSIFLALWGEPLTEGQSHETIPCHDVIIVIITYTKGCHEFKISWKPFNTLTPEANGHQLQATFSNVFSWIESFVFWFKFHWNIFLQVQLTGHRWFG